jgi:hypothetical protein
MCHVTQEPIVLVCPFLEPLPGLRLESNWNSMFLLGTHSSCFAVLILGAAARMPYGMVLAWSVQYLITTLTNNMEATMQNTINLKDIPPELTNALTNAIDHGITGMTLLKDGKAIGTVLSLHLMDTWRVYLKGKGEYRYPADNDLKITIY